MEYLENLDYQAVGTFCSLAIFSFFVGRFTKSVKSSKNFNKTLSVLNSKIQIAEERKSKYLSYSIRLSNISMLFSILLVIIVYLIYTFEASFFMENYQYLIVVPVFIFFLIVSSYACNLMAKDCASKQEIYKQQINSSKSEIIKELGPEVIEILKGGAECDVKCKENVTGLQNKIRRTEGLIIKLGQFQWCDACSQAKKCTGMCGPNFWKYSKDALTEFRLGK